MRSIFIPISPDSVRSQLLHDIGTLFIAMSPMSFVAGGICTWLEVSSDPMFLWISSHSCPLNLLFVPSHQAETIIVKRLIQGCNNVTRVEAEPTKCNRGRRKNDDFAFSAALPNIRLPVTYRQFQNTFKTLYYWAFVSDLAFRYIDGTVVTKWI